MKNIQSLILFSIIIGISISCSHKSSKSITRTQTESDVLVIDTTPIPEPVTEENTGTVNVVGPAVIVYKTKEDYYDKVPVTLSEDKTMIISFPDKKDLLYKGELALPTRLHDGYLLDNRGINKNVAFLNITYESYQKLDLLPPVELIYQMILDKDPIEEMYNCGIRGEYHDIVTELNEIIDKNKLKKYKKLK